MLKVKSIIALTTRDDQIQRWYNETPLEGSRIDALWKALLEKVALGQVQADQADDFKGMLRYIFQDLTKSEHDVFFFYRGDFIRDVWNYLYPWINVRSERPVKLNLAFTLDPKTLDLQADPQGARAYVHGILTLLAQVPAFDLEIFAQDRQDSLVLFAYEDLFSGLAHVPEADLPIIYFARNPALIDYTFKGLKNAFAQAPPLMTIHPDFRAYCKSINSQVLGDSAYVYFPYLYLYMASLDLRQTMYDQAFIDKAEFEAWGHFHRIVNMDRIKKARIIIQRKSMTDALKQGIVKVQGGMLFLGDYHQAFVEDTAHFMNPESDIEAVAIKEEDAAGLPPILMYADPDQTVLLRTSTHKVFEDSRLASIVTNKTLAQAFYAYLENIYHSHQKA